MPNYIIQKRVEAQNMTEAIRKEKQEPIEQVWIDKESNQQVSAIGFQI